MNYSNEVHFLVYDHAVLKYSHANFAILLKVDNSQLQKVFFKSV